jgi:hypothetical protein
MSKRDYYQILGITKGASADEIKMAYRRKAKELHPDSSRDKLRSEAQFKDLGEAYDVLKDANKRAVYDLFGHGQNQSEQERREKERHEKERREQERHEKERHEKERRENKPKPVVGGKPRFIRFSLTAILLSFLLALGAVYSADSVSQKLTWSNTPLADGVSFTEDQFWTDNPIVVLAVPTAPTTILGEGDISDRDKAKIMRQIRQCWWLSNVSPAAMRTSVVVRFYMNAGGILDTGSFEMTSFAGGTAADAEVIYRAVRSALVRCPQGQSGRYAVPAEQFQTRRDLQLVFDPSLMARR